LSLYESKTNELQVENDDLNIKIDDLKQKLDLFEEENIYFKSLAYQANQSFSLSLKDKDTQTSILKALNKEIQTTVKKVDMQTSPHMVKGSKQSKEKLKNVQIQLDATEEDNLNLLNKLDIYLNKIKQLELDLQIVNVEK